MSEKDNDNRNFEFIKEQVLDNRKKKRRKWVRPFFMTVFMAIVFGVIAAGTFCIAEPTIGKLLKKEEDTKKPVIFPTIYPINSKTEDDNDSKTEQKENTGVASNIGQEDTSVKDPEPVERTIDADLEDYLNIYSEIKSIVFQANKSIVKVSSIIAVRDWFGNLTERKIITTGIIIADVNDDLLILVSLDRVKDASSIKIEFTDKVVVDAVVQDYESDINLAVISVNREDVPATFMNNIIVATLGESYSNNVGNPVIALGSPNGHPFSMESGIITSKGSTVSIVDNKLDLFNTSIRDNKNSDGIIINMQGEIIGLITRTLKEDINLELNTVIGISKVKSIIDLMVKQEPRNYFGVKTEDLTETAKVEYNVSNGIYVMEARANSPAFIGGIKNGDIILQINDTPVISTNNFFTTISSFQPGDEIVVNLKRTSAATEKELDIKIKLSEKAK